MMVYLHNSPSYWLPIYQHNHYRHTASVYREPIMSVPSLLVLHIHIYTYITTTIILDPRKYSLEVEDPIL